jgi:hypothetical protein
MTKPTKLKLEGKLLCALKAWHITSYSRVSFGLNVRFDIERATQRSVQVLFSVNTFDIPTTFSRGKLVNAIPFERALPDRALEFGEFSSAERPFGSRIAHFTRETIVGRR